MTAPIERHYDFLSVAATEEFARMISLWARPGQLIALSGDLGSGKSTFARAFIKAMAGGSEFDVPSPSFALVQTYDNTRLPVAHIDLYRLSNAVEANELGIGELLSDHVVLVEWPDRLPANIGGQRLDLHFSGVGQTRHIDLIGHGTWSEALLRNESIETFLRRSSWETAKRSFLEGDASSRRYESLDRQGSVQLLMDMPQRPDGPVVKFGKPYSAIAHLAEGISAVIKVNQHLSSAGYSAPIILASDVEEGLAIIENLGGFVYGRMMTNGHVMHEPMMCAVELLADMAIREWPDMLAHYDIDAQLIEVDLLVSWFWPFLHGAEAETNLHASFEQIWRGLLALTQPEKPQWTLRDFHSPNLIWLPDRLGVKRVGLIDTQDAVMGHAAYDLVSMLQDARVDIDFTWADQLYAHYVALRSAQGNFDGERFATAFAVLGAQRATKILGIFARLAKRDGKPAYLKHMPRVSRYLKRNLEHPALHSLKSWYENYMPEALKVGLS